MADEIDDDRDQDRGDDDLGDMQAELIRVYPARDPVGHAHVDERNRQQREGRQVPFDAFVVRLVRGFLGAVVDRGADHLRRFLVAAQVVVHQLADRGQRHQQDDRARPRGRAVLVDLDIALELEREDVQEQAQAEPEGGFDEVTGAQFAHGSDRPRKNRPGIAPGGFGNGPGHRVYLTSSPICL